MQEFVNKKSKANHNAHFNQTKIYRSAFEMLEYLVDPSRLQWLPERGMCVNDLAKQHR